MSAGGDPIARFRELVRAGARAQAAVDELLVGTDRVAAARGRVVARLRGLWRELEAAGDHEAAAAVSRLIDTLLTDPPPESAPKSPSRGK